MMFRKLLRNDFQKNKWRNGIVLLFMTLSATLAISVCLMLTQLFHSISSMYETAKPPHFLQMHKGAVEQENLDAFNENYPGIMHWQTVPMIDVYGEELVIEHTGGENWKSTDVGTTISDLSECRLDLSLVKQNDGYDLLLDENREVLHLEEGEIGVPVILLDTYDISLGDMVTLKSNGVEKMFRVSAYVYDAQMNSTLCSSTRFLISDADFEMLAPNVGEMEYLIEAYFTDSGMAASYQTAYEQDERNLPKAGQAVTYTMIFLLSALTDMMMAMVFLLAGILLGVIALLCLRYCLLTELEEDAKEIGTMKAIGIPARGIRNLYLGKIRILMAAGSVAGWILAICFQRLFTGHMRRTFGNQKTTLECYIAALAVGILVYGLVMLYTKAVLRKLRKADIVDLLVTEQGFSKKHRGKDGMHRFRKMPVNLLVGAHEVRHGYSMIFVLLLLLSFLVLTPFRMAGTMADREFVTYMGSPLCDVLLEVEQGEHLEERTEAASALLEAERAEGTIKAYQTLRRIRLQTADPQGEPVGIHIDTGENAGEGLQYIDGGRPEGDSEIALSSLMAEELEKTVGDPLVLQSKDQESTYTVSGIYQDVTSGGRTAKMTANFPEETAEQYSYQIQVAKKTAQEQLMEKWREQLGIGYSIEDMDEFLNQTLGGVSSQVKQASWMVILLALGVASLMVLLFSRLRMTRERQMLMTKRAMGFSLRDISLQELYPVLLSGGLGVILGVILTEWMGESLVSLLLGMLGIGLKQVEFSAFPVWKVMGLLILLLSGPALVTLLSCRPIRKMSMTKYLND